MNKIFWVFLSIFILGCTEQPIETKHVKTLESKAYTDKVDFINEFLKDKNYNKDICFLVDYGQNINIKRFLVVSLHNGATITKGIVSHGLGNLDSSGVPVTFSNVPDSKCSSLGISLLAERAPSTVGLGFKYWMDGLESTNFNNRKRLVVLHSWGNIPDEEGTDYVTRSEGCLMISDLFLEELDCLIKNSRNKKIVIYSFKD